MNNPGKTSTSYFPPTEAATTPVPRIADFKRLLTYGSRQKFLARSARHASRGPWAEFGVHDGKGALILKYEQHQEDPFYLFDSWQGLPEPWTEAGTTIIEKGTFGNADPPRIPGTTIVQGWFEDTLPGFQFPGPLRLVHIDSDLESSARTVLQNIPIEAGTVILFDEFFHATRDAGYFGLGECRAWEETVETRGIKWDYLCRCIRWRTAVIVRSVE